MEKTIFNIHNTHGYVFKTPTFACEITQLDERPIKIKNYYSMRYICRIIENREISHSLILEMNQRIGHRPILTKIINNSQIKIENDYWNKINKILIDKFSNVIPVKC